MLMVQFSVLASNSNDDEQTPYMTQDVHKQVDMDQDLPSPGSEEEEAEVDGDEMERMNQKTPPT